MSGGGEPLRVYIAWEPGLLRYDFGPQHPFTERSRAAAVDLLEASAPPAEVGRLERSGPIRPASLEALRRFHLESYLEVLRRAGATEERRMLDQGDTPSFPGCLEAAALVVGGTLAAMEQALERGRSGFAPAGGLHHAAPDRASGFCVLNDVAVAIAAALERRSRVAYVDLDAHHGDGVMYGYYRDGRVLDIDFHQDGRTLFPGTGAVTETGAGDGAGLKVNVPLPPGSGDEALVPLARRLLPPLLREFHPELLIVQHGVDGHAGDPLAQLQYTPSGYAAVDTLLQELARESGVPLVVTGGGGYRPASVARVLALVGRGLAGWKTVDEPLPEPWRRRFQQEFHEPAPATWSVLPAPERGASETVDRLVTALERSLGRRLPAATG